MSRFFHLKNIDFLFFCTVLTCAILVFVPINNVSYIKNEISLGTLFFSPKLNSITILNYAFNVVMFVPVSILSYLHFSMQFWSKKKNKFNFDNAMLNISPILAILFSIALSVFFESTQLLLPYRVTDLDDLVLNTMGALIGVVFLQLTQLIVIRKYSIFSNMPNKLKFDILF